MASCTYYRYSFSVITRLILQLLNNIVTHIFAVEEIMSLRGVRGLIYSIAFFSCISIVLLRHYLTLSPTEPEVLYRIMGRPLEKAHVDYTRNIHFSVKTSVKNYRTRLSLLLLTWFQAVEKDQVTLRVKRYLVGKYTVC